MERPEDIRTLRGSLTRAEFARRLGVTPLTVYRWELPEDSAEARRPRGKVLERLRRYRAAPDSAVAPITSAATNAAVAKDESLHAAPGADPAALSEDVRLLLPLTERLFAGELASAEDALLSLLLDGQLRSGDARAQARAVAALCQVLARHDVRGAYGTLSPALEALEQGRVHGEAARWIHLAAAWVFCNADGRFFDAGRVSAHAQGALQRGAGPLRADVEVLVRGAQTHAAFHLGGVELMARPLEGLAALDRPELGRVARLMLEELLGHAANFGGQPAVATRYFQRIADDPGPDLPVQRARGAIFHALRLLDGTEDYEHARRVLAHARQTLERGRVMPGTHSLFLAMVDAEAALACGKPEAARALLDEGFDASDAMGWAPVLMTTPSLRYATHTGAWDGLARDARRFRGYSGRMLRPLAQAIGEFLEHAAALTTARAVEVLDPMAEVLGRLMPLGCAPFAVRDLMLFHAQAAAALAPLPAAHAAVSATSAFVDRLPSPVCAARLRVCHAVLHFRAGRAAEAASALEAARATFELVRHRTELARVRRWQALFADPRGDRSVAAAIVESDEEHRKIGLASLPWQDLDAMRAVRPAAATTRTRSGSAVTAGGAGLTHAIDRLTVRGATVEMLERELLSVVKALLPSAQVSFDANGDGRGTSARRGEEHDAFDVPDAHGGRRRLVVTGRLDPAAREAVRALTQVYALALEVASLRGAVSSAGPGPSPESPAVPGFIAASEQMRKVARELPRLAQSRATVIITGESGTGKEVVARLLHDLSPRAKGPYVALNCAAVPRELFEGVLFGYRKGAFTGAQHDSAGLVRDAHGGTLFLDEIGELPLELQAKLLRFLESREVLPLGESKPVHVDARTVAATHRDLAQLVREGRFRQDLYYRLQVIPLHLAPLRERPEDVVAMARHFLKELTPRGAEVPALAPDAIHALLSHSWPGNARELRNVLERIVALGAPRVIEAQHLMA